MLLFTLSCRYLKFDTEMREISVSWRDVEALLEDYAEERRDSQQRSKQQRRSSRHNSGGSKSGTTPTAAVSSPASPVMTSSSSVYSNGWDSMMDRYAYKQVGIPLLYK